MRARALIVMAMAIGAIAGCGVQSSSGAGGTPGAPTTAPATAPSSPACLTPKLTGSAKTFTITEKDNGKSYCVIAGTSMFVFLHSNPSRMWSQIRASSGVLQPRPSGVFTLARGVTGGYFLATRLGRVTLKSRRVPCHPAAVTSGGASCQPQTVFRVTVLVLGKA